MKNLNLFIDQGIAGRIEFDTVQTYCEQNQISEGEFYNHLAVLIVKKFSTGDLSFEKADRAINSLMALVIQVNAENISTFEFPEPMYSIYDTFDSGEFDQGDKANPVEKFTIPAIKEILKNA